MRMPALALRCGLCRATRGSCLMGLLPVLLAAVRPGALYRDIGNAIARVAKAAGFGVVRTYSGHGVHRLFHCNPTVPHYANNKAVGVIRAGHVFTIEPMINAGACAAP